METRSTRIGTGETEPSTPLVSRSSSSSGSVNLPSAVKTYEVVLVIFIGISGLALNGLGIAGYFQIGALHSMAQIDALILIGFGSSFIVLFAVGVVAIARNCYSAPKLKFRDRNSSETGALSSEQIIFPDNVIEKENPDQGTDNTPALPPITDVPTTENHSPNQVLRFGKDMWYKYFRVNVGNEPPLPDNIEEILNAPCPFHNDAGLTVQDTHFVPILIPATVDGQPFTLNKLHELLRERNTNFQFYSWDVKYLHGEAQNASSYWILVTERRLDRLNKMPSNEQAKIIEQHGYAAPKILEATICALMNPTVGTDPLLLATETRCAELIDKDVPIFVSGIGSAPLEIEICRRDSSSGGNICPVRRL